MPLHICVVLFNFERPKAPSASAGAREARASSVNLIIYFCCSQLRAGGILAQRETPGQHWAPIVLQPGPGRVKLFAQGAASARVSPAPRPPEMKNMPQTDPERGQQLAKDMAIIYINMLSQAHKNKNPKANSWEGLEVAPRLVSSLPDGEVRPGVARLLHIDFRFALGIKRVEGRKKEEKLQA